jgi:hypothetical protein
MNMQITEKKARKRKKNGFVVSPDYAGEILTELSEQVMLSIDLNAIEKNEVGGQHKYKIYKGISIKLLPDSMQKDIREKNEARAMTGLPLIEMRVRCCLYCKNYFQSNGTRSCGCNHQQRMSSVIAGREVL